MHLGQASWPVVYDTDDRRELVLAPSEALRRFGEQSVVALIDDATLNGAAASDASALFALPTWGEREDLCDEVRFRDQPSVASCSGVLVDRDLVLTAGHCARNLDCEALSLVFGYHYIGDEALPTLGPEDVYRCAEVLSFETRAALSDRDYGWIRLDRRVSSDKRAAVIAPLSKPIVPGELLQAYGFSGGVPLKIEPDVAAHEATPAAGSYFLAALDAFAGASGGPLIRADGSVVGTLALGAMDYAPTAAGCNDVHVLPATEPAEQITYAARALEGLCRDAPDTPLCRAPHDNACAFRARPATPGCSGVFLVGLLLIQRARRRRAGLSAH